MDVLKRSLVEKAGHDCGFEYTVSETSDSLTLGSALHPLHVKISLHQNQYQLFFFNAKLQLLRELKRDFSVTENTVKCDAIDEMAQVFSRAAKLAHALPNQAENDFESALDIALKQLPNGAKNTEVERMVHQRVGQDIYRKAMIEYWGGACAVTGVSMTETLRASHALPWSECDTDAQRLDVFNGFLLTANLDALFDRFLITFDVTGKIQISRAISMRDRQLLDLNEKLRLRWLADEHKPYLELHRRRYQEKLETINN